MTSFVIGCDNIDSRNENKWKNQVAEACKNKGHTVEVLSTGPNYVQSYGLSSKAEGKTGVYIIGGFGLGTPTDMSKSYYHYDYVYFLGSKEFSGFECLGTSMMDKKATRCEPGMSTSNCNEYLGLTVNEWNTKFGSKVKMILRDTFQECIDEMLGGTSNDTDKSSNSSNYKDIILDLLSAWSGQVLCYSCDEELFIHKIPNPKDTDYKLFQERVNIVDGSLNFTDINPDTTNTLEIFYADKSFILKDENLINRFGEHKESFTATEYVTVQDEENGSTITEQPITDYNKALDYGINKFYEIKSKDGRKIDLDIIGETSLKTGDWIQLYLPSYKEQCYLFVSSISTSLDPNKDYITSVSLVDAPPVLSEPKSNDKSTTNTPTIENITDLGVDGE